MAQTAAMDSVTVHRGGPDGQLVVQGSSQRKDSVGGLRIGPISYAHDLEKLNRDGVVAIVSLMDPSMDDCVATDRNIVKLELKLGLDGEQFQDVLEKTSTFIEKHRKKGVVLVYCNTGIVRSGAVGMGYLMQSQNMTVADAWEAARESKYASRCLPNQALFEQLLQLEAKLFAGQAASMSVNDHRVEALMTRSLHFSGSEHRAQCCAALEANEWDCDKAYMALNYLTSQGGGGAAR